MTLREKQKAEALKRLELLNIKQSVIDAFKEESVFCFSTRIEGLNSINVPVMLNELFNNQIKEFEMNHHALVYHAELSNFEFGTCLTLLFVSNDEHQWEQDRIDLSNNEAYCFVINESCLDCSEFGYCGFEKIDGTIKRIY